jgi:hypothetical protein
MLQRLNITRLALSARLTRLRHLLGDPVSIMGPDLIPLLKSEAPGVKVAFTMPNKARIAEDLEQGGSMCISGQRTVLFRG